MDFEEVKKLNDSSAMPTYGRFSLALRQGKGATAEDFEGKEYIDLTSGIGVNCLGWADEGWVAAISSQAAKLGHVSNLFYNEATASLTAKLTEAAGYSKAFLCNSGTEANECAVKLVRKASFDKYGPGRDEIISLRDSFHGRTMAALSMTAQDALHPGCFAPYNQGFVGCDKTVEAFSAAISERTCAVIMEMIQGEGGVIPMDPGFVSEVFRIAEEKDILVIIDEVQTGVSRTGRFLAQEHYGVKADVTTLAKGLGGGLPVGACLCTEKLAGVMTAGTHGSTFGGNPIVCAGASYVLGVVTGEDFLASVREKGDYMRERIASFRHVVSVRGLGMMIGIELDGLNSKEIAAKCVENGLMVLTAKELIRLLPPLNITKEEIDKGLDILGKVLDT